MCIWYPQWPQIYYIISLVLKSEAGSSTPLPPQITVLCAPEVSLLGEYIPSALSLWILAYAFVVIGSPGFFFTPLGLPVGWLTSFEFLTHRYDEIPGLDFPLILIVSTLPEQLGKNSWIWTPEGTGGSRWFSSGYIRTRPPAHHQSLLVNTLRVLWFSRNSLPTHSLFEGYVWYMNSATSLWV